jgi:hypothetical protein
LVCRHVTSNGFVTLIARRIDMKNGLKVLVIAAAVVLVVGTASAAVDLQKRSLTADGSALPPVSSQPVVKAVSTTLVPDGDFEYGPQGGTWSESAGTPCEWVLNPTAVWGVGPYSGFYTWWAGGYCGGVPNNNSVHQVVTVPVGTTSVDMYAVLYRPSADDFDGDRLQAQLGFKVLGTVLFAPANNTYPSWVLLSFPVSPAAGGASAALKVKGHSFGSLTGNSLIDYVSFNP